MRYTCHEAPAPRNVILDRIAFELAYCSIVRHYLAGQLMAILRALPTIVWGL